MDSVLGLWLMLALGLCAGWALAGFILALVMGWLWREVPAETEVRDEPARPRPNTTRVREGGGRRS